VSIVDVFIFFLIFLHFDTTSAERSWKVERKNNVFFFFLFLS
jgi:hypothetical protein